MKLRKPPALADFESLYLTLASTDGASALQWTVLPYFINQLQDARARLRSRAVSDPTEEVRVDSHTLAPLGLGRLYGTRVRVTTFTVRVEQVMIEPRCHLACVVGALPAHDHEIDGSRTEVSALRQVAPPV